MRWITGVAVLGFAPICKTCSHLTIFFENMIIGTVNLHISEDTEIISSVKKMGMAVEIEKCIQIGRGVVA